MRTARILWHPEGSAGGNGDDSKPLNKAQALLRKTQQGKIRAFEQALDGSRHEDTWKRSPNVTGTGAIHVKSFHCKLTSESLVYMDQQINEWLDAHPQYEVKFVTTGIGEWTGKTKEPNLVVQVWV